VQLSRETVTISNTAEATERRLSVGQVDLCGRGSSNPRQGMTHRQRQNETKMFFTVNAVVYLGLLIAMGQTGVRAFVRMVNIGVFAMWCISFAEKSIKGIIQHIVRKKEEGIAYQCSEFAGNDKGDTMVLEVERGETLEWPEDLICVGIDNGRTDGQRNMLDQADTEEKAKYKLYVTTTAIILVPPLPL
jgi:hypothetical protein